MWPGHASRMRKNGSYGPSRSRRRNSYDRSFSKSRKRNVSEKRKSKRNFWSSGPSMWRRPKISSCLLARLKQQRKRKEVEVEDG